MSSYETMRFQLLRAVEDMKPSAYRDTKGIATIGIGYNLQVKAHAYHLFDTIWGKVAALPHDKQNDEADFRDDIYKVLAKTYASTASLTSALSKVLDHRSMSVTDAQAKALFLETAPDYETSLSKRHLGELSQGQHLALFSLEYNNGKALIGKGLTGAMQRDDRAEGWYEIRYGSNGDDSDGIAKRRYYESQLFGAADDDGKVSVAEGINILTTRSRHIEAIEQYDDQFDKMVAKANGDYAAKGNVLLAHVDKSDVIFDQAKQVLIKEYGHGKDLDEVILDYTQIKAGKVGDETDRLDTSDYTVKHGALMLGQGGDDIINGSSHGDVLLGGKGVDTLYGVNGDDYLDGGSRDDKLYGGKGNDLYVVDSTSDHVYEKAGQGDVDYVKASCNYTCPDNVEILELTGKANLNATGNSAGCTVFGNGGDNAYTQIGGTNGFFGEGGKDTVVIDGGSCVMYGGDGSDIMRLTKLDGGNSMFSDFAPKADRIDLSKFDLPFLCGTVEESHSRAWGDVINAGRYIEAIQHDGSDGYPAGTDITIASAGLEYDIYVATAVLEKSDFILSS